MAGDLGGQFALDLQGLDRLKHSARQDPSGSVKEVGRQFEALFLQMMLKSMRQASPQSGLFSSQQTQFYNGMLDQQWLATGRAWPRSRRATDSAVASTGGFACRGGAVSR